VNCFIEASADEEYIRVAGSRVELDLLPRLAPVETRVRDPRHQRPARVSGCPGVGTRNPSALLRTGREQEG
jgi:hypothetical protein